MHPMRTRLAMVAGLGICVLLSGCEGNPDKENVNTYFDGNGANSRVDYPPVQESLMLVTPTSTVMSNNGQIARFTVEGAVGTVRWSVQDPSMGSILTQSSQSATYQRTAAGGNVVIAIDQRHMAAFSAVNQP